MKEKAGKLGLILIAIIVLGSFLAQGCVSSGSYKRLRKQYDRDVNGLKLHAEELGRANGELTNENKAMMMKLNMTQADRERLQAELGVNQETIARLDEGILRKLRALESPYITPTPEGVEFKEAIFSSGKAVLKEKGKEAIREVAEILKTEPGYYVRVDGHTDNEPISSSRHKWTTGSNFELAAYRALKILLYLEECGVSPDRMYLCSFGEHYPKVPNDSDANRAKNRRVVVTIHKISAFEEPGAEEGTDEPRK